MNNTADTQSNIDGGSCAACGAPLPVVTTAGRPRIYCSTCRPSRQMSTTDTPEPAAPIEDRIPGPIEQSVRHYIASLKELDKGQLMMAEMALRMARSYDSYGGADLAKEARINMELRLTLSAIMDTVKDDSGKQEKAGLSEPEWSGVSSPVRNTAKPGSANSGRTNSAGGRQAR